MKFNSDKFPNPRQTHGNKCPTTGILDLTNAGQRPKGWGCRIGRTIGKLLSVAKRSQRYFSSLQGHYQLRFTRFPQVQALVKNPH